MYFSSSTMMMKSDHMVAFMQYAHIHFCIMWQADLVDPDAFPFIVIGNKIDIDGGNSRAVEMQI